MGRPINFKKIGGNTSAAGQQLLLSAWFEGQMAAEPAFVVKQTASRTFLLAAVANPARTGIFRLGNTAVEGQTAVLEVSPFGQTMSGGFELTTVTLTSGGATTLADGQHTLEYVSGSPTPSILPEIEFEVVGGVFTAIVGIIEPGLFPTDPTGSVLTFTGPSIQTPPTVTVTAATELFVPSVENARKLTLHRVATFDGNAYKYKVGVAAAVAGEADLSTA